MLRPFSEPGSLMRKKSAPARNKGVGELQRQALDARRRAEATKREAREAKRRAREARRLFKEAKKVAKKARADLENLSRKLKKLLGPGAKATSKAGTPVKATRKKRSV